MIGDKRKQKLFPITYHPSPITLFITVERFRFVFVNVEDRQELGDCQQVLQLLRQVEKLELTALLVDRREA